MIKLLAHPEDLIALASQADLDRRQRAGERFPPFPRWRRWTRATLQPFFIFLGMGVGAVVLLGSARRRRRFENWVLQRMAGYEGEPLDDEAIDAIRKAVQFQKTCIEKWGEEPSVLLLTSHPLTTGPVQWLRFEVMRTALLVGCILSRHPRFILAIDPFALDTVPWRWASLYAGLVSVLHLAWNRQFTRTPHLQRRLFFRQRTYRTIAGDVLRSLRRRVPVAFAYPGAVDRNARLLYTTKEFLQRLYREARRRDPRGLYERLFQAGWVSASDWEAVRQGHRRLNALRYIEREVVRWLSTLPPDAERPCHETGQLSPSIRERLIRLVALLGYSSPDAHARVEAWEQEFQRRVPYRERLWRVLLRRVVGRDIPLLVMIVSHNESAECARVLGPVMFYPPPAGWSSDPHTEATPLPPAGALARSFSEKYFQ